MSGRKPPTSFETVRKTTTAKGWFWRCCCCGRFLSTVRNTSNWPEAAMSRINRPFLMLAQPACGTVSTSWPGNSRRKRASTHSSRRILIYAATSILSLTSSRYATACSWVTVGKPSKKSSSVSPASMQSIKVLAGTRVPAKHGVPLMISGSILTMLCFFMAATIAGNIAMANPFRW